MRTPDKENKTYYESCGHYHSHETGNAARNRVIKQARRLIHPCPKCGARRFEWCVKVDNAVNRKLGSVGKQVPPFHSERPGANPFDDYEGRDVQLPLY